MVLVVVIFFKGHVQSPILQLQGISQSSMYLSHCILVGENLGLGEGGGIPGLHSLYETLSIEMQLDSAKLEVGGIVLRGISQVHPLY